MERILLIISVAVSFLTLVFYLFQFWKTQELQKKNLKIEKQNFELQEKILELQQKKDAKEELKPAIEKYEEKLQEKTDEQTYCDHIYHKFKNLDFTGLNAILQKPLLLEEVYVRLRAKKSLSKKLYHSIADFQELEKEKGTKEKEDHDFINVFTKLHSESKEKQEPLKAIILGHPGSGKTTLMKWIALQCAFKTSQSEFNHFIPVFIPLKDLGRDPDNTFRKKNILELTQDQLNHETVSPSFVKDLFETNQLIFLLDGLDEVAEEGVRREVIEWIEKQNIRKNSLLVTSRFSGLQESKGLKFHDAIPVFTILDFDIDDIQRFLKKWYINIEIAIRGCEGIQERAEAEKKGKKGYEDLIDTIKNDQYENLRKLAINPLLLTIIAIVHRTRAVLPKERHKLYEECLKVMIELWNVANKKINVSFSVDNSMSNLAKLAVAMMKENRRELVLKEIEALLPGEIEKQPLELFIKEMVLKSGLLYHSEGKYGFLHLTFQEYLAAWYYARSDNPNDILQFRDKDYWTETFKLFVNIANPRPFYKEIIDNLKENRYWEQMQLWDDCLEGIVQEDVKNEIELNFAQKVLSILPLIDYKEENEQFIIQLYAHYPLYYYAHEFVEQAWQLFHEARHPFVQSVGSSILNRAGNENQVALMKEIKKRIDAFETNSDNSPQAMLDFLYQNNNSFVLLIAGRKNLTDIYFALKKQKSAQFFLVFLNLQYLHYLQYLPSIYEILDIQNILNRRYLRNILGITSIIYLRDIRYYEGVQYLRALQNVQDLRDLRDQFITKYEKIIKAYKPEIDAWADKAIETLKALSDEKLLEYFPDTTEEEIREFRGKN